jgi:hypothetical protein
MSDLKTLPLLLVIHYLYTHGWSMVGENKRKMAYFFEYNNQTDGKNTGYFCRKKRVT